MTNPAGFDFTKFVPGFDFLKNLTPGGGASAPSAAPGWVAPTLDPEELDKRIEAVTGKIKEGMRETTPSPVQTPAAPEKRSILGLSSRKS